jgi:PiT family inorganic phosphate transporter
MNITVGLVVVIAIALAFDFFNGFHDAANSIATVVSTRVLTPFLAVMWAALFNFVAFVFIGTKVAATIAKDVVNPSYLSLSVIFAGLIGAIAWNVITWYMGLPSSSSHALLSSGFRKIAVFIVLSPIIGLLLAFTVMVAVMWIVHRVKRQERLNRGFKATSLLSAAAFSLGHGANDAQKTMGLILALLIAEHLVPPTAAVPIWVVLAAQLAMGLGTAFGGWRIIHTMGSRITKITPAGGMSAQAAGAATLFFTAANGIPVSTTHTITGAIVGVGSVQRLSAVRWGVAGKVVWAWLLTIPGAFLVAWVVYLPFKLF